MDYSQFKTVKFSCISSCDFTSLRIGDKIIFSLLLTGDGEPISAPYVWYELRDDGGNRTEGFLCGKTGLVSVTSEAKAVGFLRLRAEPCDEAKKRITGTNILPFTGGALVEAELCNTVMPEPADFDKFWKERLSAIDNVPPELISAEERRSDDPAFRVFSIKVKCPDSPCGSYAAGTLTYPVGAEKGSLDLRIGFIGYGIHPSDPMYSPGAVSLKVCAHAMEQYREQEYYSSLGLANYGLPAADHEKPENSYFVGMVLRDVQMLRFLKKHFGQSEINTDKSAPACEWKGLWNEKCIISSGGSQGAFQALAVTALEPDRVKRCYIMYPWLAGVSSVTDKNRIGSTFLPVFTPGLLYFDSVYFAARIKAQLSILTGTADTLCLPASMQALYNAANVPAKIRYVQTMVHGCYGKVPFDVEASVKEKNFFPPLEAWG